MGWDTPPVIAGSKKVAAPGAIPKKVTGTITGTDAATLAALMKAAQPQTTNYFQQAAQQASQLASQQTNATIAAIQQQQQAARDAASGQANQINQATLAAAQFLSGLGDKTAQDYQAAQNNQAGLTQGYTGQLRSDADQAAQQAQSSLAGVAGNTQQVQNRGADLGNLLYGLTGQIPGNALAVQGLGAAAAARALPAGVIGNGEQTAYGIIGQGNTTADALNQQITNALAQRPQLQQSYLSQFNSAAQQQQSNDRANQTANLQLAEFNSAQKQDAIKAKQTALENTPHFDLSQSSDGYARDQYGDYFQPKKGQPSLAPGWVPDPKTGAPIKATDLPHIDLTKSVSTGIITDQFGNPIPDATGHYQHAPGWYFNSSGSIQKEPAPTDPVKLKQQQSAQARQWTSTLHYKANWQGQPVGGVITPTAGYKPSPDGSGVVKATTPKTASTGSWSTDSTASRSSGFVTKINSKTGAYVQTKIPYVGTSSATGKTGSSPSTFRGYIKDATSLLNHITTVNAPKERFDHATKGYDYYDPTSQTWGPNAPKGSIPSYQEAVQQLVASGDGSKRWQQKAVALVNANPHYAEGTNGRPYSASNAYPAALAGASAAASHGVPAATAKAAAIASGLYPQAAIDRAIKKAYGLVTSAGPLGVTGTVEP